MLNKKVVDTFTGELYYANADEVKDSLAASKKPDRGCFNIDKASLINDLDNKVFYLIGDFPGDSDWYGFTIKIFLYDNGQALGTMKFIVEAKTAPSKLTAYYEKRNNGFVIHGYFVTDGAEGKESFILYIEKPEVKEEGLEVPSAVSMPVSEAGAATVRRQKKKTAAQQPAKTTGAQKNLKSMKSIEVKEDTQGLVGYFTDLDAASEKRAHIHFLCYSLTKVGFNVHPLHNEAGLPDLLIENEGVYIFIHVYSSNKRKPSWKVDIKKNQKEHLYIFCHALATDFVPDMYIVEGSKVAGWMQKRGSISIEQKEMVNIKNSWTPLLDE